MKKISLLCATTALIMPAMAAAQSTGTLAVEEEPAIVVTGTRGATGVEGIVIPDNARAQQVLTQENIERQNPGQTILNAINIIPGVNFTQNDPYGSSGGSLRIRGFDGNRISLTFDGAPLNDTGNYAIYSNQQLDPELIERVSVNMGQTDVDSPTASAAGGTVNYRSRIPRRQLGGEVSVSIGDHDFHRVFGLIETGELFANGPRAWFSASTSSNDLFRGPGEIRKQQFNARIYQDIGSRGDFISISGHYNENRNNFYRNPGITDLRPFANALNVTIPQNLRDITPANPLVLGNFNDQQWDVVYGINNDAFCADANNTFIGCSNFYAVRINPSNTGNIRGQSRFTLMDGLILTVDPTYQYVLANGGGSFTLGESSARARGRSTAPGVDFNGDGDFNDTVRFYTPNNTNTNRFTVTSSLIYTPSREHRFRVAYTFDYGRHRQTGEWGYLQPGGFPEDVFGGRSARPVLAADGFQLQQRDRFSIASLHQIAGQYIGRFMDNRLRVEIGVRAPFFHRELNQYCLTEARGSGFAYCTSENIPASQIVAPGAPVPATGPTPYFAPFQTNYDFNAVLPNLGATYYVTDEVNIFASYARGFSAPRTDNLYRAPRVEIEPETTDSFDAGIRYNSRLIQAQAVGWFIEYRNRIITSFDQELGISVDRNVGRVRSYGFDGSIAVRPVEPVMLYAFASYISARFQEDVVTGLLAGNPVTTPTRGRFVPETPEWQFGGRAQVSLGPVDLGIQGKWVDDRFATDINDVVVRGYTLWDADARVSLAPWGLERTYLQFNVQNIFNERYFGNISTRIDAAGNPNFTPGAPRTFTATLNVGF